MINELDDAIVASQPSQQLNLVGVALIRFGIGTVQRHTFQGVDDLLGMAKHRIDLG